MDRLTSMTVFARVVATRSFSVAARELGISQATASKHVQTLESWLGARLLHRTTRRVGLTEAGTTFFAQCTRILEDMESARQTGRVVARLTGSLRIAAPIAFGSPGPAAILAEFMRRHPDLLLSVTLRDRPVDMIDEPYDIAVRAGAGAFDNAGLIVHKLPPLRFAVCAAPAYLAASAVPEMPADLARYICLTGDSGNAAELWRFDGPGGRVEVVVKGRLKTANAMLRQAAARIGAGVLRAPEFLVEGDVAAGRLVRLLPGYTPVGLPLDVVCPAQRAASPKIRSFIAFLAERLSGQAEGGGAVAGVPPFRTG